MTGHRGWNVYNGGKLIDTVFYDADCDAEYVRRGLIEHDGYPADIVVRCERQEPYFHGGPHTVTDRKAVGK